MENVSGIQFNKDDSGLTKSVTIDIEKHGNELKIFLKKLGVSDIEYAYFEQKRVDGISGDELVKRVNSHIKTLPWKK